MVQVSIDASTLGELAAEDDKLDTAAMFLTTHGSKNPSIDAEPLVDRSPHAGEARTVSLDMLLDKAGRDYGSKSRGYEGSVFGDNYEVSIDELIEHGNAGTPKDGFEDEEVQGFWRDPRDLKWAKLSGGNH